jgi:hypothetical protein
LAASKTNILSALAENTAGSDCATDRSTNGSALASADYSADDCPNARAGADSRDIILGTASTPHATFRVDRARAISVTHIDNFDHFCVKPTGAVVHAY